MRVIFILSICLFFASCGKKHTFHIKAINPANGQVYSGLKYRISQEKTVLWDEKTKVIASGELNENGEATATFRRGNHPIKVQVEWPSNCCYNNNDVYYIKEDGPNHEVLVEFAPCAYLTLSVNNINCQGASDKILFDMQPEYIPNYNNITPTEKLGCYTNTFIESQVPFGSWKATWEVTRNGITTYHDSIFFIEKNEHYSFTINY
jgi:hypothetical protein